MKNIVLLLIISTQIISCASFNRKLKSFLGGKPEAESTQVAKSNMTKFSESPNVYSGARRQYKRVTKDTLAAEAALEPQAGSLWVMEGQGAYLFSQNVMRMIGDPISVAVDGEPKEQLQSKVDVIRKLWSRYEERQAKLRAPAEDPTKAKDKAAKDEKPAKDAAKEKAESEKTAASSDSKQDFNLKSVPTRIVERTVDGNYRVKGSQPFMIGPREYKVIVTGVVRSEDFNDDGISASKLLDAKYDVVSVRHKEQEL